MATDLIISYLLLRDGASGGRKLAVAEVFITAMPSRLEAKANFILHEDGTLLKKHPQVIGS
jgi:hypothetical protein